MALCIGNILCGGHVMRHLAQVVLSTKVKPSTTSTPEIYHLRHQHHCIDPHTTRTIRHEEQSSTLPSTTPIEGPHICSPAKNSYPSIRGGHEHQQHVLVFYILLRPLQSQHTLHHPPARNLLRRRSRRPRKRRPLTHLQRPPRILHRKGPPSTPLASARQEPPRRIGPGPRHTGLSARVREP